MAYSELIKDINRIRPYIRDFYVFGLYTRNEYSARYGISPRSYDNERRRVESWLQQAKTPDQHLDNCIQKGGKSKCRKH